MTISIGSVGTRRTVARIGLIGAGGIGRAHAAAAAASDGAVLAAVADVVPAAAKAVAAQYDADCVEIAQLADPSVVDLVVVASPPASHPDVVEPLLRAGVPVLCEKPLAVNSAAAAGLAAVAEETGTLLSMATKFRFVDDVIRTRRLVADGALGELIKVEVSFAGRVDMTNRWNSRPAVSGGGVLIDNATHAVDLVRYVAGPITEVLVVAGPTGQSVEVEDSATMLARTATGALAQVDVTWSFRRLAPAYLAVHGTLGTVEVGWRGARAQTAEHAEPYDFGTGYDKLESLRANLDAVLQAIADGTPPPVPTADAMASCAVIDAGYASLHDGGWVGVSELGR